ncbi:MAG: family class F420-dependent oxidoreductase [Aeromicrobium sp.]|nr:family class F420-dependent oxidoreductase [Aeromicrobium sp.]
MQTEEVLDRLGCYVLPGAAADPREGLEQAKAAETIGARSVWIGERYDSKDLPTLASAIGQVTSRVGIGAAVTHPGLRHPMVLASMGQTLQALTGDRFVLGLGRSAAWRWKAYGVKAPTLRSLGDIADILRALWAGETVAYDGPLGTFPQLRLPVVLDVTPPPLLLAAIGPKTLELAGRSYDGVILHPMLTPDGVKRSVETVRTAAEQAGRDPDAVRCIAAVVVAPDADEQAARLAVHARAAGYLSVKGLGDALTEANGWSVDDLAAYRAHPELVKLEGRPADKALSRPELIDLALTLPDGWLSEASVVGTSAECVTRLGDYLDAGATEIILHGTDPSGLLPLFNHEETA